MDNLALRPLPIEYFVMLGVITKAVGIRGICSQMRPVKAGLQGETRSGIGDYEQAYGICHNSVPFETIVYPLARFPFARIRQSKYG